MTTLIDFSNPILDKQTAEQLATNILDDFYVSENVYNKFNLYFVLEISIIFYEKSGDTALAAHLSFLAAYYIFYALTPPGSYELALYHMSNAIRLNDTSEYREQLEIMKKGN